MAPQAKVEIGSAEIYFAKKLASNDVKLRNRSLKRLKIWLTSKSESETGKQNFLTTKLHQIEKSHFGSL